MHLYTLDVPVGPILDKTRYLSTKRICPHLGQNAAEDSTGLPQFQQRRTRPWIELESLPGLSSIQVPHLITWSALLPRPVKLQYPFYGGADRICTFLQFPFADRPSR